MKEITIKPKLNGWAVKVGCQDVLFTSKKKMLCEISRYIDSPKEVQEEYLEDAKNETQNSITFRTWDGSLNIGGSNGGDYCVGVDPASEINH